MHTSSVVYHRLYFRNIEHARNDFADLVSALDLQETDRPDVYDLVLEEGSELTIADAIDLVFPEHMLEDSIEAYSTVELVSMLGAMAKKQNVKLHTGLFNGIDEVTYDDFFDLQISAGELFDLINIVANGYEIIGIFSEWSMFSNKSVLGAHSGGTSITTRKFLLNAPVDYQSAERLILEFCDSTPEELANFYVDHFVKPAVVDCIVDEAFQNAVFDSLRRLTSTQDAD